MTQAQTYFNDCWLEDVFKSWLSKAADKKQTRCQGSTNCADSEEGARNVHVNQ